MCKRQNFIFLEFSSLPISSFHSKTKSHAIQGPVSHPHPPPLHWSEEETKAGSVTVPQVATAEPEMKGKLGDLVFT